MAGLDFMGFLDERDALARNLYVHVADQVLLRRAEEREDQAVRTINALGKQLKRS